MSSAMDLSLVLGAGLDVVYLLGSDSEARIKVTSDIVFTKHTWQEQSSAKVRSFRRRDGGVGATRGLIM
jgi:hypothetical protein